mgnify:CR=1 FL=1
MKRIKDRKIFLTLMIAVLFFLPSSILTGGSFKLTEEIDNAEELNYRYISNENIQISFNV